MRKTHDRKTDSITLLVKKQQQLLKVLNMDGVIYSRGKPEKWDEPQDDADIDSEEDRSGSKEPKTVEDMLKLATKQHKMEYTKHESFHTIYVREDLREMLFVVTEERMSQLFFTQLTSQGSEGGFKSNFDETPKNCGLQFCFAPNKKDVMLVEAQAPIDGADRHLAGSMYSSGRLQSGVNRILTPLVHDTTNKCVLLDMTQWLFSFSQYFGGDAPPVDIARPGQILGRAGACLLESVNAFPQNFFFQMMLQKGNREPLKPGSRYRAIEPAKEQPHIERRCSHCMNKPEVSAGFGQQDSGETEFFTVAFGMLPAVAMVPRPADKRVGYFTTTLQTGSSKQPTTEQSAINRWNIKRHGGHIVFCIDKTVPEVFHNAIKKGAESWNQSFSEAGCGEAVVQCISPADPAFPANYQVGDARFNSIFMAEPDGAALPSPMQTCSTSFVRQGFSAMVHQ